MKIAIVGTAFPYRGGIAAFNERLAAQFQTIHMEVEKLTLQLDLRDDKNHSLEKELQLE